MLVSGIGKPVPLFLPCVPGLRFQIELPSPVFFGNNEDSFLLPVTRKSTSNSNGKERIVSMFTPVTQHRLQSAPISPRHLLRSLATIFCLAILACASSPVTAQDTPPVADTQSFAAYQNAIAELDGAYPAESAELYLSLAQALTEGGAYDAAASAYQEALQALRIHEGLASPAQHDLLTDLAIA